MLIMVLIELGVEGFYLNIVRIIYSIFMSYNYNKWGKIEIIFSEIKSKLEELVFFIFF